MADQSKYNKLQSKRVLVFGGTSGIGFGVAEGAVESGATVTVTSSNKSRVEGAVSRLQSSYPSRTTVSGLVCNLGDDETLEANIERVLKEATDNGQKKLDHIVYTAADPIAIKSLKDFDLKAMHAAGRMRFFAPLLIAKYIPEYMTTSRESSFTVTTGSVAERPIPNWSVVASYAGGHFSMVKGLSLDLAPLRCNGVAPGAVDTELWNGMDEQNRTKLFKQFEQGTTTGRVAAPSDVAEAYLYLMKDYNVTGHVISTNGGHMLK